MRTAITLFMRNAVAVGLLSLTVPMIASAQTLGPFQTFLRSALNLVNVYVIPLMIAAAVLYFFWGLIQYIRKPEEETRKVLFAGIVALVIMFSIYGIVFLVGSAFGINNVSWISTPQVGI